MRACILNSQTMIVENIIELDNVNTNNFVPYKPNVMIATRHDGEIGWQLATDGNWIIPDNSLTEEQIAEAIRQKRNKLLKRSDKYILMDFPIDEEKRSQWLTYRQALRNISDQEGFPTLINWPEVPK
jgi:hypothetical protein